LEPFLLSIATLEEYELALTNSQLRIGASLSYLVVSASGFLGIFAIAEARCDGLLFWQDFCPQQVLPLEHILH
jgi:hypothetical protein